MCGMIAGCDGEPIPMSAPQLILVNRMKVEGFIVGGASTCVAAGAGRTGRGWWPPGKLSSAGSRQRGLCKKSSTGGAFLGLLKGRDFGEPLVSFM